MDLKLTSRSDADAQVDTCNDSYLGGIGVASNFHCGQTSEKHGPVSWTTLIYEFMS